MLPSTLPFPFPGCRIFYVLVTLMCFTTCFIRHMYSSAEYPVIPFYWLLFRQRLVPSFDVQSTATAPVFIWIFSLLGFTKRVQRAVYVHYNVKFISVSIQSWEYLVALDYCIPFPSGLQYKPICDCKLYLTDIHMLDISVKCLFAMSLQLSLSPNKITNLKSVFALIGKRFQKFELLNLYEMSSSL